MAATRSGVSLTRRAWYLGATVAARGTRLALALALLQVGCSPAPRAAERDAVAGLGPCSEPALAEAKCATIEVDEDRSVADGRKIGLAVVVVPPSSGAHTSEPLFLLAGGPGQGAAALAPYLLTKLAPLRRERELVLVDVRGTGASNPLACELGDPDDVGRQLGAELDLERLEVCLAAYEQAGTVDLRLYNTPTIVDDLDEVRAALGYDKISLLGISYGTAVAQVYMRRHGEHVAAAVLDGVVPLDRAFGLEHPRNAEAALLRVLSDCREQPACEQAYGGLERKLAKTLDGLDEDRELEEFRHPRTGELVRADITRAGIMEVFSGALYGPRLTTLIPLAIERAHAGDYGPLAAMSLQMNGMSDSISMGLYFSVACAEGYADLDEARRAAAIEGLRFSDGHWLALMEQICARWPHAELPPSFAEPLRSELPTLLLSGRYDPVTPPRFAEHLLEGLSEARHVEVASGSHGVWNLGCTMELVDAFLTDPDPQALDPSCLEQLQRPAPFVNASGPWPLRTPSWQQGEPELAAHEVEAGSEPGPGLEREAQP